MRKVARGNCYADNWEIAEKSLDLYYQKAHLRNQTDSSGINRYNINSQRVIKLAPYLRFYFDLTNKFRLVLKSLSLSPSTNYLKTLNNQKKLKKKKKKKKLKWTNEINKKH